ncbi:MAG TPA: hypothetical protein VMB47_03045 [Candidatus Aquilonibacter sp.]|nr:hypothetical protein [Candidatus Aquilonibacter sp.]
MIQLHNSPHASRQRPTAERPARESGYAYIMALFMVLTVIIGSQIVLRNLVTESRSQREAEMIWRGNQYVRAIELYYRKAGHYPQSQDDLVKGIGTVHFLRAEAMTDPMNTSDGSWRFIYTNASGAIIGSVKYGSLQQMALMDMNGGVMPGTQPANGSSAGGQSPAGSSSPASGASASSSSGFSLPSLGSNMTPATGTVLGPLGQPVTGTTIAGPQPTGPVDGPVFGGMLIGVGSTVDKASVRVYKGGTKYNQWEFIWNPIEEQARATQQGLGGAGQPAAGVPGLGGLLNLAGSALNGGSSSSSNNGANSNSGSNSNSSGSSNTSGSGSNDSNNSQNPTQ